MDELITQISKIYAVDSQFFELVRHIENICAIDWQTFVLIALLCAASAYVLKDYMAKPVYVIFAYPILFTSSVLFQYAFMQGELYDHHRIDQWLLWTILASICGNVVGIAIVAGLGRLADSVGRVRKPTHLPRRAG